MSCYSDGCGGGRRATRDREKRAETETHRVLELGVVQPLDRLQHGVLTAVLDDATAAAVDVSEDHIARLAHVVFQVLPARRVRQPGDLYPELRPAQVTRRRAAAAAAAARRGAPAATPALARVVRELDLPPQPGRRQQHGSGIATEAVVGTSPGRKHTRTQPGARGEAARCC